MKRSFNYTVHKVPFWRELTRARGALENMFTSLIRRKSAALAASETEAAFESTTVSLSTSVPRPAERRQEERISAMLRIGKMTDSAGAQQLIRIKNLSAGGLMAIVTHMPSVGDQV